MRSPLSPRLLARCTALLALTAVLSLVRPHPAHAAPAAPSIQEFVALMDAVDERLADSASTATALGLVHARWAELAPPGTRVNACKDSAAESLAARSRAFGDAHRDAAEAVRALVAQVERQQTAATIAPLLQRADLARVRAQVTASRRALRTQTAFADWHRRHIEPASRGCTPALRPGPGFADPVAGRRGDVAVVLLDGATLCPSGLKGTGAVVLIPSGKGCISATCDCTAATISPGAVLGP